MLNVRCNEQSLAGSQDSNDYLLGAWRQSVGSLGCSRAQTLARALRRAVAAPALRIVRSSRSIRHAPLGPAARPAISTRLLAGRGALAPGRTAATRQAHRAAGRPALRPPLGAAPPRHRHSRLSAAGASAGRPRRRAAGRLILPHPEMHRRAFVLVPLLEVAPHWRHPVLGVTGAHAARATGAARGARDVAPKPLISAAQHATRRGR